MNLQASVANALSFVGRKAGEASRAAISQAEDRLEKELDGATARVAERIGDNPTVQLVVDRLGKAAAAPTQKKLQPTILLAALGVAVVVVAAVYFSRKR